MTSERDSRSLISVCRPLGLCVLAQFLSKSCLVHYTLFSFPKVLKAFLIDNVWLRYGLNAHLSSAFELSALAPMCVGSCCKLQLMASSIERGGHSVEGALCVSPCIGLRFTERSSLTSYVLSFDAHTAVQSEWMTRYRQFTMWSKSELSSAGKVRYDSVRKF